MQEWAVLSTTTKTATTASSGFEVISSTTSSTSTSTKDGIPGAIGSVVTHTQVNEYQADILLFDESDEEDDDAEIDIDDISTDRTETEASATAAKPYQGGDPSSPTELSDISEMQDLEPNLTQVHADTVVDVLVDSFIQQEKIKQEQRQQASGSPLLKEETSNRQSSFSSKEPIRKKRKSNHHQSDEKNVAAVKEKSYGEKHGRGAEGRSTGSLSSSYANMIPYVFIAGQPPSPVALNPFSLPLLRPPVWLHADPHGITRPSPSSGRHESPSASTSRIGQLHYYPLPPSSTTPMSASQQTTIMTPRGGTTRILKDHPHAPFTNLAKRPWRPLPSPHNRGTPPPHLPSPTRTHLPTPGYRATSSRPSPAHHMDPTASRATSPPLATLAGTLREFAAKLPPPMKGKPDTPAALTCLDLGGGLQFVKKPYRPEGSPLSVLHHAATEEKV